jgi:protein involved in polysaccharide export with SLBB domain
MGLLLSLDTGICFASSSSSLQTYRLGSNDVLHIQVYGEDDLNVERKIDGDGTIHYPLLGVVSVAGKTVREVQEDLTGQLAQGYVRNPKVTVYVVKHRNFYVSGEVKTAGAYPYEEGLTVHKALSLAGGRTEKAERGPVKVTRVVEGVAETKVVAPEMAVLPDDILVVEAGNYRFYVSGEVKIAGGYRYEEGLTVHKAISVAGGRTEKAERGPVKVTRVVEGVAETKVATPEMAVLPDDIIVVEIDNYKFYVSGEVKNPSGYPHREGLTVHQAIAMAGGLTEKAERRTFQTLRRDNGEEKTIAVGLDSPVMPDDIIVVAEGQRVYVSGEVKTPGRYLYEKGLTVHKAISMAGGWTEKAERGTIKVNRVTNDEAQSIETTLDAPVLPDDFIVVPQLKKIYVNGEVKRAGDYPYERGLTVHKVITMAGGFTDKAAESRTKVLRKVDGREQTIQVDLETLVLPEDILVVPRSFF